MKLKNKVCWPYWGRTRINDKKYNNDSDNVNTIGDKLNIDDEYNKINECIHSNNVEEDSGDETTVNNDRPRR